MLPFDKADEGNSCWASLMAKGKLATAAYLYDTRTSTSHRGNLNAILDNVLDPKKSIDNADTIEWCKWLVAAGRTPDEFTASVRSCNDAATCGLVWTPNFVAYRCRTCGISPCMSLCTECFKNGNHYRHDFNMFLSQAGGACDCGDTSVMKESGFCYQHGPDKAINHTKTTPIDLTYLADILLPRIFYRLILHFRHNWFAGRSRDETCRLEDTDAFINMLLDFDNMGSLMRRVITTVVTNSQVYADLNNVTVLGDVKYTIQSQIEYQEALATFPDIIVLKNSKICTDFVQRLDHKTLLDELVFWVVKFEFPQRFVCLLLHMLPDANYKEAFTRAFVIHYSRISMMLERSRDADMLSNRVVHISVQLFSNKELAYQMTEELDLLKIMIVSLISMMQKILISCTWHNYTGNVHKVVDCSKPIMREHSYWPLVSDLNNILSHRGVALKFMSDATLLKMWFEFLAIFQGMNVNKRATIEHVEFEPNTYYAAFSAELEAGSYPMWALMSHLNDESTASLTRKLLFICLEEITNWLHNINFFTTDVDETYQVSFHLPLHRYFAIFLCQGISMQGITLDEILPKDEGLIMILMHPLRLQIAFYEILNGLWARNGLQMKGQAMTYIQCSFCTSMLDADIYLLQICSPRICSNKLMKIFIDRFHINNWFNPLKHPHLEIEYEMAMVESFLTFLTTLVSIRNNIGLSEHEVNRTEMVALLCMANKTHSQLIESMPDRCGSSQTKNYDALLNEIGDYHPSFIDVSGTLHSGTFSPKPFIWEHHFDPIHLLLRAVHRKDFQSGLDRYIDHIRHAYRLKSNVNLWPPLRTPKHCSSQYEDPRRILESRIFHAVVFITLYKAVRGSVSEHVMAFVIFLLSQTLNICQHQSKESDSDGVPQGAYMVPLHDLKLYSSDCILDNLFVRIQTADIEGICETPSTSTECANSATVLMEFSDTDDINQEFASNSDVIHQCRPNKWSSSTIGAGSSLSNVGDSIISLLLKLHSRYSAVPDSFKNDAVNESFNYALVYEHDNQDLIGDGAFFVGKLLNKISRTNKRYRNAIQEIRGELWPHVARDGSINTYFEDVKEEKRRRAKERQRQFLAEFRDKQKRFMEQTTELDPSITDMECNRDKSHRNSLSHNPSEYDCIICNQSRASTNEKPLGVVALVQSTKINSHRIRFEQSSAVKLPCCDDDVDFIQKCSHLEDEFQHRVEELDKHFDTSLWHFSLNLGCDGGVYMQTCGHHLHFDCLNGYLASIKNNQPPLPVAERALLDGEFLCPLCRQLANCVLPLMCDLSSPKRFDPVNVQASITSQTLNEIGELLRENNEQLDRSNLTNVILNVMNQLMGTVYFKTALKPLFPQRSSPQERFLTLASIVRTNLEVQLEQRGGTLISEDIKQFQCYSLPQRNCIVPLLHLISANVLDVRRCAANCVWMIFQQLCDLPSLNLHESDTTNQIQQVPLLLHDPIALLFQLVILLPNSLEPVHFVTIVQLLYNLLFYQVVAQICCGFNKNQKSILATKCDVNDCSLSTLFAIVNKYLESVEMSSGGGSDQHQSTANVDPMSAELEQDVQILCLPFLRIAALLMHYMYREGLPEIQDGQEEFHRLVVYLRLGGNLTQLYSDDGKFSSSALVLNWPKKCNMYYTIPLTWCIQFTNFAEKQQSLAVRLLRHHHVMWSSPRLVRLPFEYESIFTYYHNRPCQKCKSVPQDSGVCLICGTIVCLKHTCCKEKNMTEATLHALECGAGTGIFLVITSTYIVIISGPRACLWGSLYLDEFEEEDRDLKRGKPLFLNEARFKLLQYQWLAHRFDSLKKTWIAHRNDVI